MAATTTWKPHWPGPGWSRLARWAFILIFAAAGATWLQREAVAQTGSEAIMSGPMRTAQSPLGLMVGDYVAGSVVFVDPETMAVNDTLPLPTEQPAPPGEEPGPILRTNVQGVAWMNGLVYVGDERTGAIQVYEKPGAIKKNGRVETNPKKIGEWTQVSASLTGAAIGGPSDIAADEVLGLLFVASQADRMIYVLDQTGTVTGTIGDPGSASVIKRPQGLALDRDGQRVYVSDDGDKCGSFGSCSGVVRVYDYQGTFLGQIPGNSAQYGFSRPQGLDVDGFGRLYLVDSLRGQVLAFDEDAANSNTWTGVGKFGSKGSGVKELLLPMDVVVDEGTSTLYVTNPMNGRVEVFTFEDMVMVP